MPQMVEGKSVSWSKNEASSLVYFWNCSSGGCSGGATGWELGLSAPQITVRYNANVYNADTGALIIDGSSLTVGTRLRFAAAPYSDSDIDWAATGYTNDSPNGHWINGAAAPAFACEAGDISAINANDGLNNRYTIYTPLSINPPNSSLDFTGTTTALTNQGGGVYRVDSSGAIQAQFVFAPTYGEFYYRYKMTFKNFAPMLLNVNQCYGNQTPMEVSTGFSFPSCFVGFCPPTYGHTDYRLDVPQMSVPFSFTVPSTNNNPNPPSLTGPTTGSTSTNYPFTTQASDMDGDQVRYGIDWDNNNTVDEWTAYVASNTAVNTNHQWATPGTYTLKALTQDSKSAVSGWSAPLTITIQTIVNGACGAANGFPTTNPPAIGLCFSKFFKYLRSESNDLID